MRLRANQRSSNFLHALWNLDEPAEVLAELELQARTDELIHCLRNPELRETCVFVVMPADPATRLDPREPRANIRCASFVGMICVDENEIVEAGLFCCVRGPQTNNGPAVLREIGSLNRGPVKALLRVL